MYGKIGIFVNKFEYPDYESLKQKNENTHSRCVMILRYDMIAFVLEKVFGLKNIYIFFSFSFFFQNLQFFSFCLYPSYKEDFE